MKGKMQKKLEDFFFSVNDDSIFNGNTDDGLVIFPPDIHYHAICKNCAHEWNDDIEIISWYPIRTNSIKCPKCGKTIKKNEY